MSYFATALAVTDTLQQIVHNLDVQVDQLTAAATEFDARFPIETESQTKHSALVEAFRQLALARVALVNAHGEISGTVPNYFTRQEPIR